MLAVLLKGRVAEKSQNVDLNELYAYKWTWREGKCNKAKWGAAAILPGLEMRTEPVVFKEQWAKMERY